MNARHWLWPTLVLMTAIGCTCRSGINPTLVSPEGKLEEMPTVVRVQLDKPLYDPAQPVTNLPEPKVIVEPGAPFRATVSSPTTIDVAFAGPLAPATDYVVTVKKGIVSNDLRSELKKDVTVKFRTPLNRLERIASYRDERLSDEELVLPTDAKPIGKIGGLGPEQAMELRFRFPVTLAQANELVKVFIKDGAPVPVTLELLDKDPGTELTITPKTKWPRDTALMVSVAKGLGVATKNAGKLTTDAAQLAEVRSWGPTKVELGRMGGVEACVPPKVLTLLFSNPVNCSDVMSSVVTPANEGTSFQCVSSMMGRKIRLEASPELPPEQDVVLTVQSGITDAFGEELKQAKTFSFRTCQQGTSFAYQKPFVIIDPGQPSEHVERVYGASALKVEGKRINLTTLWSLLRTQELTDQVAWTEIPWWLSSGYGWFDEEGGDSTQKKLPGEISEAAIPELEGAQSVTVPVKSDLVIKRGHTTWRDAKVGIDQFLGGKRGLVLLRTTPLGESGNASGPSALRVVNMTDIGLTARMSNDTLTVLAAGYSDGKPIGGARVAVQTEDGKQLASGDTGSDGVLSLDVSQLSGIAGFRKVPLLIVATKGDDESFVWTQFVSDRRWESDEDGLLGDIYADRGIYRPGEKVHLKAVVRFATAKGFSNPAGQPAQLVVRDAEGSEVLSEQLTLSEFGTLSKELTIEENAKVGGYTAQLTVGNASVYGNFMVGEFRRAEMKVEIHAPDNVTLGSKLNATIQGDYLFGAPAAGMDVRWSLSRSTTAYHSQRFSEASFNGPTREEWWSYDNTTTLGDGTDKLNDKGAFVLSHAMNLPEPVGQYEQIHVNASVDDANGQSVSASKTIEMFAGKVLVGIESRNYLLETKKPTEVTVVAVKPDDALATNVPIRVVTKQVSWRSVRREGPGGGYFWTSEKVDHGEVERCRGKTDESGRMKCTLTPEDGGSLQIIAEAQDGKRTEKSATWTWVYGDPNYWGGGSDNEKVSVLFEKKEVTAGDTAKVAINSPFRDGYALITVEREDILWKKAIPLGTTGTVEIPTQASWAPNVHVVATVVRGRIKGEKADPEHDKPAYAFGRAELTVKPKDTALTVKVASAQIQLEPGLKQTVTATVTRPDGKPATETEVNLWAVDEGVLSLTAYKTPDLLASMYQKRGWKTLGLDTRAYILGKRVFVEPVIKGEEDGGGGGDQNESRLRKNFDPLAVYVGSAITNAQGKVETTFTVPDTLTTYRVMAVAVSKDDRFGSGDAQFKVNKTLMLRQALPRFARPGDAFTAGVLVNHLAKEPTEITVNIESIDEKVFKVGGAKTKTITVKPNETKAALFDFTANDTEGASEVRFSAQMKGHQDRVELKLPLNRLQPRETVAASGVIASGNLTSTLTVPELARAVSLDVNVSGIPLSALEGRLREMVHYPYGCLEQRTSQALPLVAIRELGTKMQMKSVPVEKIKEMVEKEWLALIPRYRCSDGGFDYWPGCQFGSSTYLTSFALEAMLAAKKYGYTVEQGEIDRTVEFLKRQVESGSKGKDLYGGHGHTAGEMMSPLRVLAEAGKALPDVEKASFDRRGSMPLFAKAELTRAISTRLGDEARNNESVKTLVDEIGRAAKEKNGGLTFDAENPKDNWWAWESDQHNTALVLRTLVQVNPADGRIPLLVKGLIDLDRASPYYITSDTTQTLLGLVEVVDRVNSMKNGGKATITVGGETLGSNVSLGSTVQSYTVPGAKLTGQIPIDIVNNGEKPVYFGAFLTYGYPATVRLPSTDNGFTITREFYNQKNELIPLKKVGDRQQLQVRAGDFVKVKLKVAAKDEARLVVIEDPLPAGLEPLNAALATSDQEVSRQMDQGNRDWWNNYHREYRDDRVEWHFEEIWSRGFELNYVARATTAGTYQMPGSHAERMYQPMVNGRATAIDVVVLPKE